ncbi:hypothetical protein K2W90_02990 [Candidatus Babeliales bacterium]|nr:hypothetical protein [Candidatus Babeliales bacterium]
MKIVSRLTIFFMFFCLSTCHFKDVPLRCQGPLPSLAWDSSRMIVFKTYNCVCPPEKHAHEDEESVEFETEHHNILEVSMAHDLIFTAGSEHTIKIWSLTGDLQQTIFTKEYTSLTAIAADKKILIAGYEDGSVDVWRRLPSQNESAFLFSPDPIITMKLCGFRTITNILVTGPGSFVSTNEDGEKFEFSFAKKGNRKNRNR